MKIFLDDIRNPKTNDWVIVRNYKDCIELINLLTYKDELFEEISMDHDLGEEHTGYDVAKYIESLCYHGMKCPKWNIHSANTVGSENIKRAMENAERWSKI